MSEPVEGSMSVRCCLCSQRTVLRAQWWAAWEPPSEKHQTWTEATHRWSQTPEKTHLHTHTQIMFTSIHNFSHTTCLGSRTEPKSQVFCPQMGGESVMRCVRTTSIIINKRAGKLTGATAAVTYIFHKVAHIQMKFTLKDWIIRYNKVEIYSNIFIVLWNDAKKQHTTTI